LILQLLTMAVMLGYLGRRFSALRVPALDCSSRRFFQLRPDLP
jgi:hypothetical protein